VEDGREGGGGEARVDEGPVWEVGGERGWEEVWWPQPSLGEAKAPSSRKRPREVCEVTRTLRGGADRGKVGVAHGDPFPPSAPPSPPPSSHPPATSIPIPGTSLPPNLPMGARIIPSPPNRSWTTKKTSPPKRVRLAANKTRWTAASNPRLTLPPVRLPKTSRTACCTPSPPPSFTTSPATATPSSRFRSIKTWEREGARRWHSRKREEGGREGGAEGSPRGGRRGGEEGGMGRQPTGEGGSVREDKRAAWAVKRRTRSAGES
jgi:hypothetical protein